MESDIEGREAVYASIHFLYSGAAKVEPAPYSEMASAVPWTCAEPIELLRLIARRIPMSTFRKGKP
jgi:hypothetical protein